MDVIKINIDDIKIPDAFLNSCPKQYKLDAERRSYMLTGKPSHKICLSRNDVLFDGYVSYVVLKEMGYSGEVEAYRNSSNDNGEVSNPVTTWPAFYVFGRHSPDDKERVWRLTNSVAARIGSIKPGDHLTVQTRFGLSEITVTKMKLLATPPIEGRIRKVKGRA